MFRFVKKVGLPSLIVIMAFVCVFMAPMASAKTTTPPKGTTVKVLSLKAKSIIIDKKFKSCLSYAEKLELPAPPRDPLAHCKGNVTVKAKAKVKAVCKSGYLGGSATATLNVTVKVRVRAFSQAIASGRAWALARTSIRSKASGKVYARVNCVKPPAAPQVTPPHNPQPAVVSCPGGTFPSAAGNCVAQSNSSSQEAEVKNDCKGGTIYGNQCVTHITQITIQVNANCSQVKVVNGDDHSIVYENLPIICSNITPPQPPKPPAPPTKDGTTGAGSGNAGDPTNAFPGAGDSGTAPSADCFALDGNNDPTIPGTWNNTTKVCTPV